MCLRIVSEKIYYRSEKVVGCWMWALKRVKVEEYGEVYAPYTDTRYRVMKRKFQKGTTAVVMETDPRRQAVELFVRTGGEPCKHLRNYVQIEGCGHLDGWEDGRKKTLWADGEGNIMVPVLVRVEDVEMVGGDIIAKRWLMLEPDFMIEALEDVVDYIEIEDGWEGELRDMWNRIVGLADWED